MLPDDPRHGTKTGYKAGCRNQCCRDGAARYERGRQWDILNGRVRRMPAVGIRRRMNALACLGWPAKAVAERCGFTEQWLHNTARREWVQVATHRRIARVYDELSMTLPPENTSGEKSASTRARRRAQRNGWAPPLAWDDIDTDPEPWAGDDTDDVDHVLVARICAGDGSLARHATRAERAAVIAAWTGHRNELERLTGWNVTRENRSAA